MDAVARARDALAERIDEIEDELARVRTALRALDGAGPRRRAGGTPRVSRTRPTPRVLAARGQRREQLLAYLKEHPNSKPVEIAKGLEITPNNVQNVLRSARKDKMVRKVRGGGYRLANSAKA